MFTWVVSFSSASFSIYIIPQNLNSLSLRGCSPPQFTNYIFVDRQPHTHSSFNIFFYPSFINFPLFFLEPLKKILYIFLFFFFFSSCFGDV